MWSTEGDCNIRAAVYTKGRSGACSTAVLLGCDGCASVSYVGEDNVRAWLGCDAAVCENVDEDRILIEILPFDTHRLIFLAGTPLIYMFFLEQTPPTIEILNSMA